MMNIFSSLKRFFSGWFTDELVDDEPPVTHTLGSKRNYENQGNENILTKRRRLTPEIDDDILNIQFPKPVFTKETFGTMPRRRNKVNKNTNKRIPTEVIEINDDDADPSNQEVIKLDLTESDPKSEIKRAGNPAYPSSSSSDVEFVTEYSVDQCNKAENPPLKEINNYSLRNRYLMEPRKKGASTSSTSSSQSPTCSLKNPSSLLSARNKEQDRRRFLSLLTQYAYSPPATKTSSSCSTISTSSDTLPSTQHVNFSSRKTSQPSRSFLANIQTRRSYRVPSSPKPSSSMFRDHNTSAIEKSVIDLTSEDDDEKQREEIVSTIVSSDYIKNLKTTFVGKDQKVAEEDFISNILRKYESKLRVQQQYADKLQKNLRAQSNELNKTLSKIFDQKLIIKEHKEEIEEQKPSYEIAPITETMTAAINQIMASKKYPLVIIKDTSVKLQDIRTLENCAWLNDEVINAYMNLIKIRAETKPGYPKAHCFNTFLYEQLQKKGYNSVRRWTKKIDIFDYTMLIIPIHLGNHWCLIQIKVKEKCIRYFDSMGSPNNRCLQAMVQYLVDEYKDKKNGQLDPKEWKLENAPPDEIPQQRNMYDCGVFACTFAEHLTRNARFNFSQDHMPYFRVKMIYEILTGELLL